MKMLISLNIIVVRSEMGDTSYR